jgi:hypothetical protein
MVLNTNVLAKDIVQVQLYKIKSNICTSINFTIELENIHIG